jgi:hypothetical protein
MNAKTKIIALACVALLSLTGTASAHHGANTTKAWAGKVAGTTAATDPATAIGGHALLVDGTDKNVLAVKVRNLKPKTAYSFALDGVSDFAPTTATTDENGKLKGFVTSDTFNATDGATYTVVVKEGDITVASSTLAPVQREGFGHGRKHRHKHGGFKKAHGANSGDPGHSAGSGDPGHNCSKGANDGETAKA